MHIQSGATGARNRRWWWLLCLLVFAVAAGMQVYLAVSMTAWWAWAAATVLALVAAACGYAAQRRI